MKIVIFIRNYKTLNVSIEEIYAPKRYKLFTICDEQGYQAYKERGELGYFEQLFKLDVLDIEKASDQLSKIATEHPNLPMLLISTRDQGIEVCAKLNKKFNLNNKHILAYVDKVLMKQALEGSEITTPAYVTLRAKDRENLSQAELLTHCQNLNFPLFAKPTNLIGSQLVKHIDSKPELAKWLKTTATYPNVDFEVDEFIEGELYFCDSFIKNGNILYTQVSKNSRPCADFMLGVNVGSIVLKEDNPLYEKLSSYAAKVLDALIPPHNGLTHLECFIKSDGEIIFLEVAARPAGGFVPKMYEKHLGVNIDKEHILLNIDQNHSTHITKGNYTAAVLIPKKSGIVESLKEISINSDYTMEWFVKPGEKCMAASDVGDAAGRIVMDNTCYKTLEADFEALCQMDPVKIKAFS